MKYCQSCKHPNADSETVCTQCHAPLPAAPQTADRNEKAETSAVSKKPNQKTALLIAGAVSVSITACCLGLLGYNMIASKNLNEAMAAVEASGREDLLEKKEILLDAWESLTPFDILNKETVLEGALSIAEKAKEFSDCVESMNEFEETQDAYDLGTGEFDTWVNALQECAEAVFEFDDTDAILAVYEEVKQLKEELDAANEARILEIAQQWEEQSQNAETEEEAERLSAQAEAARSTDITQGAEQLKELIAADTSVKTPEENAVVSKGDETVVQTFQYEEVQPVAAAVSFTAQQTDSSSYPKVSMYVQAVTSEGTVPTLNQTSLSLAKEENGIKTSLPVSSLKKFSEGSVSNVSVVLDAGGTLSDDKIAQAEAAIAEFADSLENNSPSQTSVQETTGTEAEKDQNNNSQTASAKDSAVKNTITVAEITKKGKVDQKTRASLRGAKQAASVSANASKAAVPSLSKEFNPSRSNDAAESEQCLVYDGIKAALTQVLQSEGHRYVIACISGKDTGSSASVKEIAELAEKEMVPIYIIASGESNTAELKKIAAASGGLFSQQDDLSKLSEELDKIHEHQQNLYVVEFTDSSASGKPVSITIEYEANDYTGQADVSYIPPEAKTNASTTETASSVTPEDAVALFLNSLPAAGTDQSQSAPSADAQTNPVAELFTQGMDCTLLPKTRPADFQILNTSCIGNDMYAVTVTETASSTDGQDPVTAVYTYTVIKDGTLWRCTYRTLT